MFPEFNTDNGDHDVLDFCNKKKQNFLGIWKFPVKTWYLRELNKGCLGVEERGLSLRSPFRKEPIK